MCLILRDNKFVMIEVNEYFLHKWHHVPCFINPSLSIFNIWILHVQQQYQSFPMDPMDQQLVHGKVRPTFTLGGGRMVAFFDKNYRSWVWMMRERYCANAKGFPGVDRPVIHVSAKNCIQFSQSDKADKNMEL